MYTLLFGNIFFTSSRASPVVLARTVDLEAIEVDISTTASAEENEHDEGRPSFLVIFAA
jgi:hypothetical protein